MSDPAEAIARIAGACSGRLGLAASRLGTPDEVHWRDTDRYRTASVVKVAVHAAVLAGVAAGAVDPARRVRLDASDQVGGSGVLNVVRPGLEPTVEDLCTLMIVVSDNTATNMVIDLLGGVAAVNGAVAGLGFGEITLHRRLAYPPPPLVAGPQPPTAPAGTFATATPSSLWRLVSAIHAGTVVDREASGRLLATLAHQQDRAGVPRAVVDLPEPGEHVEGLPEVAAKTGAIPGARTEAGILTLPGGTAIAYAVMADDLADTTMTALSEGDEVLGRVGAALVRGWWPGPGPAPLREGWPG